MPHSFNLVDEKWLPCVMLDGRQEDLSLFDALSRASEVREVFDESPLVTVALHRLLLAILHRNFGPPSFKVWQSLWKAGRWDTEKLIVYFQAWRHRFDLFDEERPFYQVVMMDGTEHHPAMLLKQEAATGNNATLFDHSFNDSPSPLIPAESARCLIARQAFSIGGGISKPFNFYGAALTRGVSLLALGDNLFETLALNLMVYNEEKPITNTSRDLPAWENEQPAIPQKEGTPVNGYMDYLTWQSRRIHLIPEGEPTVVRRCQIQQNLRLPELPVIFDPFKCFLADKEQGFRPLPLSTSKALWRDSHTLFQSSVKPSDGAAKRPELFNHLARVDAARDEGSIEARPSYAFAAYGFATDPGKAASVLLWAHERLPLPLSYLDNQTLVERLDNALGLAVEIARTLRSSLRHLAKLLIAPQSDALGGRQPDKNDIGKLADSFAAEPFYWSRIEPHFKTLLTALPQDTRADEFDEKLVRYGETTVPEWARVLRRTALAAFTETAGGLDSSARSLKAAAMAEQHFGRALGVTMKEFMKQYPALISAGGDE